LLPLDSATLLLETALTSTRATKQSITERLRSGIRPGRRCSLELNCEEKAPAFSRGQKLSTEWFACEVLLSSAKRGTPGAKDWDAVVIRSKLLHELWLSCESPVEAFGSKNLPTLVVQRFSEARLFPLT